MRPGFVGASRLTSGGGDVPGAERGGAVVVRLREIFSVPDGGTLGERGRPSRVPPEGDGEGLTGRGIPPEGEGLALCGIPIDADGDCDTARGVPPDGDGDGVTVLGIPPDGDGVGVTWCGIAPDGELATGRGIPPDP